MKPIFLKIFIVCFCIILLESCENVITNLVVYPNPCSGEINLSFALVDNRTIKIEVFDELGQKVLELNPGQVMTAGEYNLSYNLTGLQPGFYMLVLSTEIGEQAVQKIIVQS